MASPYNPLKMFSPRGRDVGTQDFSKAPAGPGAPSESGTGKESAEQAGYMELEGAQKDADCSKVEIEGGVSSALGCCNEYQPQEGSQEFRFGTCTFVSSGGPTEGASPQQAGNSQPVIKGQPS